MSAGDATVPPVKQTKQQCIVVTLRERIVSGELPLGCRLSSRAIRQEFQACAMTTQAAITQLVDDGFLFTRANHGTFVSLTPPHLTTYAVVFPTNPLLTAPDGTFHSVLAFHCLARQQAGQKINLYFNVTGHIDDEDYQRLLADISAHRLSGIFFLDGNCLHDTPLFTCPRLARVTIEKPTAHIPGIKFNQEDFFTKGLDYLAARGRRRVAILGQPAFCTNDRCTELLAARGLQTQPYWLVPGLPKHVGEPLVLLRHYSYLILRDPADRPDGLLVSDDIAVNSVVAGIIDAGLRVGEDIDVVAHCNYPQLMPDQWPVKRLGWPIPMVLDTVFTLLDRQRHGEEVPSSTTVPFIFAEEYHSLQSTTCALNYLLVVLL